MTKIQELVSVIIANYNGETYLPTCLKSVLATKYGNIEFIIVDDGSTDKSIQIIKSFAKKDKRIHLLKNNQNLGAAASRNKAAKVAKGEILVFLDNDTEVTAFWVLEMIKTLSKDKKIGGCQALLMDFKRRDTVQVAGTKLWAQTGWGLPIGVGEKNTAHFKEMDIVALSAALTVRKAVFNKVKGFDELEAVVTEDLDLSWRIWIAGYKVVLSPKAIVFHWTKSVDMRKNMQSSYSYIYFHLFKNSLISLIKNYSFNNAFKYIVTSTIINIIRAFWVMPRIGLSAFFSVIRAGYFVFLNRKNILNKRRKIQSIRKVADSELIGNIVLHPSIKNIINIYS